MATAAAVTTPPTNADEAYKLVKNLIFHQVHKFRNQYGGEFDELVGEANEAFVRGHQQFCRGTSPTGRVIEADYGTEIRRWVWYTLFDKMRTRVRRQNHTPMEAICDRDFAAPATTHNTEWAEELSDDARYAVELVLHPPEAIEATAEAKGGEPRNYRSTVRQYLRTQGWAVARVNEAFSEIKGALG